MNSPLLSEATGGTDTQQLVRMSRPSPTQNLSNGKAFSQKRSESSISLEGYLVQAAQNNDIQEISTWLDRNIDLDITSIIDQRRYTLLHFSAFNNQFPGVILLINHIQVQLKRAGKNEEEISGIINIWVNKQTDDGFSAIHFAAYRGNVRMIEYLQQLGANIYLKNKHGMNVLHISAQGDQPISLAYFKYQGIEFEKVDVKGGTALHWAAFYGCEQAVNYLLAWKLININKRDLEGLTPLHLGCMSGNSRVVKRLLLKGADKEIRDNKMMYPRDIARENEFQNIERMLTERNNYIIDYYNVRPGFRKIERSKNQLLKFILLYCLDTTIAVYFTYYKYRSLPDIVLFGVSQTIVISLFILVCAKNPGYLVPSSKLKMSRISEQEHKPLITLLKQFECFEVCPECEIVKPPRSKHCDVCEKCVGVYDHHCPWVDNCIGMKNHAVFYCFILTFFANLVLFTTNFILFFVNDFENVKDNECNIIKTHCRLGTLILVTLALTICGVFLIPMLLLITVQTKNLLMGKTTYERYSSVQNRLNSDVRLTTSNIQASTHLSLNKESVIARKQQMSLSNCITMCYMNKENIDYIEDARTIEKSLKTVDKDEQREQFTI